MPSLILSFQMMVDAALTPLAPSRVGENVGVAFCLVLFLLVTVMKVEKSMLSSLSSSLSSSKRVRVSEGSWMGVLGVSVWVEMDAAGAVVVGTGEAAAAAA